jgi:hypothetical protein
LEPYIFWKSERGVQELFTYGIRSAAALSRLLDYNVEMALQGGHERAESIRAWAGHWELGVRPFRWDLGPRLGAEYNFASGDSRPGDGRHATFDDLYPSGYNKYGMPDPFAWRNIRTAGAGVDFNLSAKWSAAVGYRAIWLATLNDGLSTKGEECLTRNPDATTTYVGNQASLMVTWEYSRRWKFHTGYSRFTSGGYLHDSGYHGQSGTPFLAIHYTFER